MARKRKAALRSKSNPPFADAKIRVRGSKVDILIPNPPASSAAAFLKVMGRRRNPLTPDEIRNITQRGWADGWKAGKADSASISRGFRSAIKFQSPADMVRQLGKAETARVRSLYATQFRERAKAWKRREKDIRSERRSAARIRRSR